MYNIIEELIIERIIVMPKNLVMMQGFEWYLPDDGNYYKDLMNKAKDLKASGIDAIWLPPMFKATGTNDVGYGAYDLYDLGEFDQKGSVRTKYGTFEELKACIDALHKEGILVYADVILNHKAAADEKEIFKAVQVDENNRNKEISKPHDIEAWTKFTFPGRKNQYSDFCWNFNHFSGVDYDEKTQTKGVFRILGENKGWDLGVSNEKGNFDYLMFADIDHAHPDVKKELFHWAEWFINKIDIDGFRFDALKHIDDNFIRDLIVHLEKKAKPGFYFFGEYWMPSKDGTNRYLYETKYHTDLFDVGLHYNFERISKNGNGEDIRKVFDNSIVQEHPTMSVTFVNNHDSEPGQSLESYVEPWFQKIAYGLILLRKDGYPCIFYGDYYGIGGEYNIDGQKEMIDNLIWIRKNHAYGEQIDYMKDSNLMGFVRLGDHNHPSPLAVVISTGNMAELSMNVGTIHKGKTFVEITGDNDQEVVIDEEGNGIFQVGPGTLTCWVLKEKTNG